MLKLITANSTPLLFLLYISSLYQVTAAQGTNGPCDFTTLVMPYFAWAIGIPFICLAAGILIGWPLGHIIQRKKFIDIMRYHPRHWSRSKLEHGVTDPLLAQQQPRKIILADIDRTV